MIARTLPFLNGSVTQTKLLLPAHWANLLINGERSTPLDKVEQSVIREVTQHFGWCVDMEDATYFAKSHDVAAYGIPATDCGVFTFVTHH